MVLFIMAQKLILQLVFMPVGICMDYPVRLQELPIKLQITMALAPPQIVHPLVFLKIMGLVLLQRQAIFPLTVVVDFKTEL